MKRERKPWTRLKGITQLMQENTEEEINSAQKDEGPS